MPKDFTPAAGPSSGPTVAARTIADLAALLRARCPVIWITTGEDERAERIAAKAAEVASFIPFVWDFASGLSDLAGKALSPVSANGDGPDTRDPSTALRYIRDTRRRAVYIMRDLPPVLTDPSSIALLKALVRELPRRPLPEAAALIVLSPRTDLPPELSGVGVRVELPLPDREELARVVESVLSSIPDAATRAEAAPNGTSDLAVSAVVGLPEAEATAVLQKSLVESRRLDPEKIMREKRRLVSGVAGAEWIEPDPRGLAAVGGLDALKAWLTARRGAWSREAREYGLPSPRGILAVGPPGTGKSLVARCIGAAWGIPVIRADVGGGMSKWQGVSESNMRAVMRLVRAISPAVLWLDEIEKQFSGVGSGEADGGTLSRIFGSFLTTMQETSGVFAFFTANDVTRLPPELLRKGRLDEIFSLDLPNGIERAEILTASLRKYNRAETPDGGAVAAITEGFSGAEIDALIPAALYRAFSDGRRPLNTADLLAEARVTVPLSRTAAEKLSAMRRWAAERARPASTPPTRDGAAARGAAVLDFVSP